MARTTRSNRVFSPWEFTHVSIANPRFNFEELLRARVTQENAELDQSLDDPVELGEEEESTVPGGDTDPSSQGSTDLGGTAENTLPTSDAGPSNLRSLSSLPHTRQARPAPDSSSLSKPPTPAASAFPPPPPSPEPFPLEALPDDSPQPPNRRKRKRNEASHKARAKKRALPDFEQTRPRKSIRERYNGEGPEFESVECPITLDDRNTTSTAFVGKRDTDGGRTPHSLEYFKSKGFEVESWDGIKPKVLVDKSNRLIGILAGHPDTPRWPDLHRSAAEAMEACRVRCEGRESGAGRRGPFFSLRCGVSHGGGQKAPSNLQNSPEVVEILEELIHTECFQRVSGFSNSVLATRAPDLYGYYAEKMGSLHRHDEKLKRPFRRSVYSACTLNVGPRTCCYKHRDSGNLAFGMCAITPFGNYDPTRGGHLVLWDCHMVIEFPPGSTILIPSAILAHSNTTIQPNECRYSFTQYTSGSLFRWVENGFQAASTRYQSMSQEELKEAQEVDEKRWEFGLSLLPILPITPKA